MCELLQRNVVDCGVFVLLIAEHIGRLGLDVGMGFRTRDIANARQHIARDLLQARIGGREELTELLV